MELVAPTEPPRILIVSLFVTFWKAVYAEASPHLTNHRPASVAKLAKDDATAGSHDAPVASHAASNASVRQSGKLGDLERSKVQLHKIS
jgi:hypothetical protein